MNTSDKEPKMSASAAPWNQPDEQTQAAAEPIKQELEAALRAINTPEKADALAERLAADTAGREVLTEAQAAPQAPDASAPAQAQVASQAVEAAVASAQGQPVDEAAAAIEAIAAEAAALEGPAYEALVEAVQQVTNPTLQSAPEQLQRPRRYLRDAIMARMSFFQRYDTALFLAINTLPHTPTTNAIFNQVSFWFNGGWAWLLGVAFFAPFQRKQAVSLLKRISLPIWVAALVVEIPVKKYFRRRRPFIDVVRAIVVGKKPGNWSFPSGHSAAAFAGAWMLGHCLPRWRPLWYTIASLVAFSRVYLGAHYPGDILSGGLIGTALAEATRRAMARFGLH
jgi:membrane-associated phospholipid phosphatase